MKNVLKAFLCAAILTLFCGNTFANDYVKFKGWKQAETTHFRFIYEAASEEAAKKYAEFADEAWEKIARIYSMPQEKTNVYVLGRMNVVNAYTFFTPPEIVMFDSPLIDSYFGQREDWMKIFFTHELIHIANITFEDKQYLSAKILGEMFRGMDYSSIPGWALEGLTTVLETELTNGGRGRSPYFELEFKSATLDNNFIPYRLIGTEMEPPHSQIYVMGYLIMRSIADRWGIEALADIERNRTMDRSWEQSIKYVTGKTPQDIYREAKIALQKKYANERKIPEGKIISPNDVNVYYSKPAIIFDDGSMIATKSTLYGASSVVLLKPGANDGQVYYEETLTKEANVKETVINKASFDITADINMNIYSTEAISRYDRRPYSETQFPIYKWTKDEGSRRLTKDNSSYYQLSISRNGSLLVAVEQNGLKMRLVKIDTESGEKTVLFQDDRYSFIQPAVNEDGTKVAFLLVKGDRACIALGDPATGQYKIVNNTDYDFITDPSNPGFNKDGTLTFCSNDRGRLEAYEAKLNSDGQTFTCTPMLSDPIGVLWVYKNDMGIFYTSQASTGDVIKIKPVEEWGNIPDFEGPSPAGEIMTFGHLQDDYPDFNPYKVIKETAAQNDQTVSPEEQEITLEQQAQTAEAAPEKETEESEETAAEEAKPQKEYLTNGKHRSQKKIDELESLEPAKKELTNEKRFVPYVSTLLFLPTIDIMRSPNKNHIGIGALYMGSTPRLQMRQGTIFSSLFYFPSANNITGNLLLELPVLSGTMDLLISRNNLTIGTKADPDSFTINNLGVLGYTLPIISRGTYKLSNELDFLAFAGASFAQTDTEVFSITSKLPYSKQALFQTGINYSRLSRKVNDDNLTLGIENFLTGTWDFTMNKLFLGYEGEFSAAYGTSKFKQEASVVVRYTDFPKESTPLLSRAHFNGTQENCLFPGKILLTYTYSIPNAASQGLDMNIVLQGLASFGKSNIESNNTPDTGKLMNFNLEKKLNTGIELSILGNMSQKISFGYAGLFDFSKEEVQTNWSFYINCRMNWIRF